MNSDNTLASVASGSKVLRVASSLPLTQHPAAVYLAGLASERSRRVTAQALRTITALVTCEDAKQADILLLNWSAVRYPHTTTIRSRLMQTYSPATINRFLSALRGVLREASLAFRLPERRGLPAGGRCAQCQRRDAAGRAG